MGNSLLQIIKEKIREKGPIPFDYYMELCLYHPTFGYYSCSEKLPWGKEGDYFTSVKVGNTFCHLLALTIFFYSRLLDQKLQNPPKTIKLVELGAGDGSLAFKVLEILKNHFPFLYQRITYFALEQSPRWQNYIKEKAKKLKESKIVTYDCLESVEPIEAGLVIANEFFDSLPVKQIKIESSGFLELHIGVKRNRLTPQFLPSKSSLLIDYYNKQKGRIQPSQVLEVNLHAQQIISKIANTLKHGYVLIIDYGNLREDLFYLNPEGTLRGFYCHQLIQDLTSKPGKTDITSDVNFSDLIEWSKECGFYIYRYQTQLDFFRSLLEQCRSSLLLRNRIKTTELRILIHPDFMGERFKVLTLKR